MSYDTGFSSTWLSFVSLERGLNRTLRLRGEVSRFAYESTEPIYYPIFFGSPVSPPIASAQATAAAGPSRGRHATIVPIALGFRWQGESGPSGLAPYFDFQPTLFVVHWDEDYSGYDYTNPDTIVAFSDHATFTRAVAGLTTGLGVRIRGGDSWALDYGVQFRRSAELAHHWPPRAAGPARAPLRGARNVSLAMGISWSPGKAP